MKHFALGILAILVSAAMMLGCGGGSEQGSGQSADDKASDKKTEAITADMANGKAVYDKACATCHDKGIGGAAKMSNKERWLESAEKGMGTMVKHVNDGYTGDYGVIPPKGNCQDCSEEDIYDGVAYMLQEAGVLEQTKK